MRPYCRKALHDALKCGLDVAAACGVRAPALVPGNIGAKAARTIFSLRDEQVVEVGNAWGFVLDLLPSYKFAALMLLGHPGKLAKLAQGQWDTHSARSDRATEAVARLHEEVLCRPAAESPTVEGIFAALSADEKKSLADALAGRVRQAVAGRLMQCQSGNDESRWGESCTVGPGVAVQLPPQHPPGRDKRDIPLAVVLVDMAGRLLGSAGDLTPWQ